MSKMLFSEFEMKLKFIDFSISIITFDDFIE